MKIDIMKNRGFGRRQYAFDRIEQLFKDDNYLREKWAENCGIKNDDGRAIYGWPELFEKFYDGYYDALRSPIIIEMVLTLKDLIAEGQAYYSLYPNSHRMDVKDYFSKEIYLIDKIEEVLK